MIQTEVGEHLEVDVRNVRKYLKEKLLKRPPLTKLSSEFQELLNILSRTVSNGESDSALIVGPRGCGKSLLLETCLEELSKSQDEFVVVNLNGLVHIDDSLALRSIIEQLHVQELDGDQIAGSFSDNLLFVLQSLKSCNKENTVPIIIVLDEFQLFCSHRNQTLLYNLFDLTKSAQAPLCVIGITTRYDITELLEKRVSSRFSHRQILLMPTWNVADRISLMNFYLHIGKRPPPQLRNVSKRYIEKWDKSVEDLVSLPKVMNYIQRQLDIEPSTKAFKSILYFLVSGVTATDPYLTVNNTYEAFQKYYVDGKVDVLKDLSVLELCLVIAMCHHSEIYEGEPFNFEMITKRYLKFALQNSSIQIIQRPILLKAFERIKELELILPISSSHRNQKKEYVLYNLMVTKFQLRSAINSYAGLPTEVAHWASGNVI